MNSLRGRLFVILVAATTLVWLCGFLWIYAGSKARLERVLDARLQEAARMVSSLVSQGGPTVLSSDRWPAAAVEYERQLSCQIWSLDGQLLARSGSAPDIVPAAGGEGFADRDMDGETWRFYVIENPAKGVRVMVGDRLGLRDQLVANLASGLLLPALVIIPALGPLLWASLRSGLRPLSDLADELRARDAEDMRPVSTRQAPDEVAPLTAALNALFLKVEAARRHEREVTALAAHELRTPLAGLKLQAQVAMAAEDAGVRNAALTQLVVAIDRTARLVRQLLVLARFDAGMAPKLSDGVSVGGVLAEVLAALGPVPDGLHIIVDPELERLVGHSNHELLGLALRNVLENALQHSPPGGTVRWRFDAARSAVILEDEGPGIPEMELPQVRRRFFQGTRRSVAGCGLGLSIVDRALATLGTEFLLENRVDRSGLRVVIPLPAFGSGQAG